MNRDGDIGTESLPKARGRMDWSWMEAFVHVAQHGSLSAAARASGISQPSLSRHIASLEQALGVTLFDRTSQGLALAPAGLGLVEHANTMFTAANLFALHATSQSQTLEGTVRITASDVVSTFLLPELLAKLREAEPKIQIEILASDAPGNLLQREADIAIRMYRPTQQDVISKKLGYLQIGLFASKRYVEKNGEPKTLEDFKDHTLIGYDSHDQMIQGYKAAGIDLNRGDFALRCDNQVVTVELCKAGCGIAPLQKSLGLKNKDLVPILNGETVVELSVWLTAHAELRTSARIARVYEFISEHLTVDEL